MDSYWAEAYGLLSLATLLDLMSKFFYSPLLSGDNLSVKQTKNVIDLLDLVVKQRALVSLPAESSRCLVSSVML
jgi:hypothetical protein